MAASDIEKSKSFSNAFLVAFSSFFGYGFELFDFTAFFFASTLLAPYFFPASDAATSTLYAFLTASLSFFSRPIGGILFGHFGDRIGRKSVWFISLIGMGFASFAMGFLPTYQQVGIIATVALVLLRLSQGIFLAGEQAGGWVLVAETAPAKWRAFFSGIVGAGPHFGQLLVSIAIFVASVFAPGPQFPVMGWRIIFWMGILPLAVALIIRWKASESVEWKAKAAPRVEKVPILAALRTDLKFFLIIFSNFAGQTLFIYASVTFLPSYLRLYTSVPPAMISTITLVPAVVGIFTAPVWGVVSDVRRSRRKYLIASFLIDAAILYPVIVAFSSGDFWLAVAAGVVLGVFAPMAVAAQPPWIAENTRTAVRYSMMATASGFGSALGGIGPSLVLLFTSATTPLIATSGVAIIGCLIAAFTAFLSPPDRAKEDLR